MSKASSLLGLGITGVVVFVQALAGCSGDDGAVVDGGTLDEAGAADAASDRGTPSPDATDASDASTANDASDAGDASDASSCPGAGTACEAPNKCRTATIQCPSAGAPACVENANVPNGTFCGDKDGGVAGTDKVCELGVCTPCTAGAACTPVDKCHKGTLKSCSSRPDECIDTGALADDGITCGADKVCSAGACVDCVANAACKPANDCHTGLTSCATGASVCVDQAVDVPDTTACGPAGSGRTCTAGVCGCPAGQHDCAGICSANNSTATCGARCTACPMPAGSVATCNGSSCGFNCGGPACDATKADACNGTACACGVNAPCGFGLTCQAGACICDPLTCRNTGGCCAGNLCRHSPTQTASSCFSATGVCQDCHPTGDHCIQAIGCSCGSPVPGRNPQYCPNNRTCFNGACQ